VAERIHAGCCGQLWRQGDGEVRIADGEVQFYMRASDAELTGPRFRVNAATKGYFRTGAGRRRYRDIRGDIRGDLPRVFQVFDNWFRVRDGYAQRFT
jgi:hypothetical protein